MKTILPVAIAIAVAAVTACNGSPIGLSRADSADQSMSWRALMNDGWAFSHDGGPSRTVDLPHDWGVEGDFDINYAGESGKLPWQGEAWYRKTVSFTAEDLEGDVDLEIEGAMSNSTVHVNGIQVGGRPYGYSSYYVSLVDALREGENEIAVHIDNPDESSRWYPGGGIYRNVYLEKTPRVGIAQWGTFVTTALSGKDAVVTVRVTLKNHDGAPAAGTLTAQIPALRSGDPVASMEVPLDEITDGKEVALALTIPSAKLWNPADEKPAMYRVCVTVTTDDGREMTVETPFGVRTAEFRADGFYLNGEKTFLRGVCLHHDGGAIGAAWNTALWQRRLTQLKEMGCNAIRCSHNPPAPELLDLCDNMGFLVMDELTDTWTVPKKENGYAKIFDEWVEKDLVDMIHRDRNHPSVVLWSIGNECGEQGYPDKWDIPRRLTEIVHREDPTRLSTAGNDNLWAASTDYASTLDVYGFNYKPQAYAAFRDAHPGQPFLGSETASCISTRGYYLFPVSDVKNEGWVEEPPYQISSYDLYAPPWASKPDYEWYYEDQVPECAGEFVWTGFDYLGEPTPYTLDPTILTNMHDPEERAKLEEQLRRWGLSTVIAPSRSSYFGIIDLAGFPKDRYWLYQARWRPDYPMVHVVPHWTWPGREGETTPVHVYTSGDSAELFINGKSQGVKTRGEYDYRLRWDDAVYEPGELKVIAFKGGVIWAEQTVRTAGKPYELRARLDYVGSPSNIIDNMLFVTVDVVDRDGNLVPDADNLLTFRVKGPATLVATDAGDPTSLVPFNSNYIPAFHGKASALVKVGGAGIVQITVSADGLGDAVIKKNIFR